MLNRTSKMNFSIIIFLVVFSIIGLAYMGLKIGASVVEKKNVSLREQILSSVQELNGSKSVDDVIDLQVRLGEIKNSLAVKADNDVVAILDKVSKSVMPGIIFSSYTETGKKVAISLRSSNFDSVSKQIYNFKQAEFVSSVEVKSLDRDAKGIKCDIEVNLK